jgi:hypothetical protein
LSSKRARYINIYRVGNDLCFDGVPPEKPPKEAPAKVKKAARSGCHAVRCAVRAGLIPGPDMKRGKKWLWNEEKFERWKEDRERETKKADQCANTDQPKSEPHANEATDDGHVPRRKQKVNASPGEVRHG